MNTAIIEWSARRHACTVASLRHGTRWYSAETVNRPTRQAT